MHAEVRVGLHVNSKLKGSTVFLKFPNIKFREFGGGHVAKWVQTEEATFRGVLQGCQSE
jgi:hypothetical protein